MTATLPLNAPADVDPAGPVESGEPPAGTSRAGRIVRGRPSDPAWVRPSLLVLLLATAALYLWDLGASGWANTFYSAAVQAGTKSWEAFFFGSSDASNFITVDKPPASLWVMELSARLFGVNAWSILVPQALEGVAAVGVLYATVRRWFSPAAALLAGAVLALTPVATLMFRFNNPDALLVLLLVGAAYAMTRAVEKAGTRWLLLAGALVGFGFITKMMQAFLVVPVFALVYLVTAPTPLRRRIGQLLLAGVALVVASGWWVAVVELVPSSARPYIGGSQDNSVLSLILGYNGLGRLTGNETGSVGGGAAGAAGAAGTGTGMWGATGWSRLFNSEFGGQVAWLIPAALVSFAGLLWMTRRAPRTDRLRASVLLWGGWLIVTGLTFSFAQGIIHPYYAVALAPAIAALVGIGATTFYRSRHLLFARAALALGLVATSVLAYVLLDRSPDWNPWLRYVVVVGGVGAAAVMLVGHTLSRRVALTAAAVGVVVSLAAPAAYSLETAATPHSGSIPSAGPSVSSSSGGFGGPGGPGGFGGFAGRGGPAGGGPAGPAGAAGAGAPPAGAPTRGGAPTGGNAGGLGSLLNGSTASTALVKALESDASSYTWAAAAVGANSAAGYQLASGEPVMSIGGFNGTDPAPSLAQFERYVSEGKIHYFIAGGGIGGGGGQSGSSSSSAITAWVEAHYTATTIGGTTVYDLTATTSSTSSS